MNMNFTGNSAKLEDSSTSCAKMKKAGHMESEVYILKNPDDKWPRIAYCDGDPWRELLQKISTHFQICSQLDLQQFEATICRSTTKLYLLSCDLQKFQSTLFQSNIPYLNLP